MFKLSFYSVFIARLYFSYQGEVNRSMAVYRQKYEDWFNGLSEAEREAESARMNSNKTTRKPAAVKVKQEPKFQTTNTIQQQPPTQILANLVIVTNLHCFERNIHLIHFNLGHFESCNECEQILRRYLVIFQGKNWIF